MKTVSEILGKREFENFLVSQMRCFLVQFIGDVREVDFVALLIAIQFELDQFPRFEEITQDKLDHILSTAKLGIANIAKGKCNVRLGPITKTKLVERDN